MSTGLAVAPATLVFVALAFAAMAIGVLFKRPCLRGSCGGRHACTACPNRRQP